MRAAGREMNRPSSYDNIVLRRVVARAEPTCLRADTRARGRPATHPDMLPPLSPTVHVLLGSHGGMDDLLSDLMDLRVFFRFRIHHDEHSRRSPCSRMALKHGFTRFSPPPTVKISRFPPSESKRWRGKSRKNPNGAGKSERGANILAGKSICLQTGTQPSIWPTPWTGSSPLAPPSRR